MNKNELKAQAITEHEYSEWNWNCTGLKVY